jgi:hypothetical protein
MLTTWVWIIVTKSGYFTGTDFSNLLRDVKSDGFFFAQDAAKSYATWTLGLAEEDFHTCRVAL